MASDSSEEQWELIYWGGFPGRGELVRMMFEIAGVPYVDLVHAGKWTNDDLIKYVFRGGNTGYPGFAPPIIRRGGFQLFQTIAILEYLGKEHGLYPANRVDGAHAMQIAQTCADIIQEGITAYHPVNEHDTFVSQMKEAEPKIKKFREERIPRRMANLEAMVAANLSSSPYSVGDTMTYCDVWIGFMVRSVSFSFPDDWKEMSTKCPSLCRLHAEIMGHPRMKEYLASNRSQQLEGNSLL